MKDYNIALNNTKKKDYPLLTNVLGFQCMLRRLIYLTITKANIYYVIQILSKFMRTLKYPHKEATLFIVKYIKNFPNMGLVMKTYNKLDLHALCDCDYARCELSKQFVKGFRLQLRDSLNS